MSKNTSWGLSEYDIWTDERPVARVMREQMPYLLTADEREKQPVTPAGADVSARPETDLQRTAQKATEGIVNLLTGAAKEQFHQKQEQARWQRQFPSVFAPKIPATGDIRAVSPSLVSTFASQPPREKEPDVTEMMNTQFHAKVPQAQTQNPVRMTPLAEPVKPASGLIRKTAESVASGALDEADAYSRANLRTIAQKTRENAQDILEKTPAITESVMSGMTEDGGDMAIAHENAQQGKYRVPPVIRLADALNQKNAEQLGRTLTHTLSAHAAAREGQYGRKLDNPEVAQYWKQGMENKVRNARNSLRRLGLTADGYMKSTFGDKYISYEKDLLQSYRQEQALIDGNRLISPSELLAARNSDEFAEKLEKFGYQTVLGGKLVDIVGLFAGNHVPLGVEKLYQAYDAIAQLYTHALLKNDGNISKATVLGSMVGKSVAEWNGNIRQIASGMGPVTGTMLLIINDTMTNEAKEAIIGYVGGMSVPESDSRDR